MNPDAINWNGLEKAKVNEDFGRRAWLTFYLMGQSDRLETTFEELRILDAVNLHDEEGGFVYAKVPVSLDREEILERIRSVRLIAAKADIDLHIIDLDASHEVARSSFYTLWTAPDGE